MHRGVQHLPHIGPTPVVHVCSLSRHISNQLPNLPLNRTPLNRNCVAVRYHPRVSLTAWMAATVDASLTSPLIDLPSATIFRLTSESLTIPVAFASLKIIFLEPTLTMPTLLPSILPITGRGGLLIGDLESPCLHEFII